MSKTTWHAGAPPSIGWWPAINKSTRWVQKTSKVNTPIRWFDGKNWSIAAYPHYSAEEAATYACYAAFHQSEIKWCARWWT